MNKQEQRQKLWCDVLYTSITNGECTDDAKKSANEAVKAFDEAFPEQHEPTEPQNDIDYVSILTLAIGKIEVIDLEPDWVKFRYLGEIYGLFKGRISMVVNGRLEKNDMSDSIEARVKFHLSGVKESTPAQSLDEVVVLTREEADWIYKIIHVAHDSTARAKTKELLKIK